MGARTRKLDRRDFLGAALVTSTGALGCLLGSSPQRANADTPGVTGSRVVWAHDPRATSWDGDGYYGDHVDQDHVDHMVEEGIKALTGAADSATAWRRIVPDYAAGKKIAIKVNINNSLRDNSIDALPGPVNAVIRGLKLMGVSESDIYVMEPSRVFPTRIGDPILARYPGVLIWDVDWGGAYGHPVSYNAVDASLSIHHGIPALGSSLLPDQFKDIAYYINMPIMKGHWGSAGVTLAFKNNFGLIQDIARLHPYTYYSSAEYSYDKNPLIDIYLNTHIKTKTVLIVGDALFAHRTTNAGVPKVWDMFGGTFPNSIFLSTDPVAIDSVMYDFSNAEDSKPVACQLYLHRATEVGLGTHDHWNNPTEKEYAAIDFVSIRLGADRTGIDRSIANMRRGQADAQSVLDRIRDYGAQ